MSSARSKRFNSILIVFIVGFLIYTIYEYWPIINQRILTSNKSINNAQIGSLFYFFALCVLFQFHLSKKFKARITVITILSACFIIGFYSGNRTAFFGFLISLMIYLSYYSHIKRNKIYTIIIVCFVIIVSLILLPKVNKSIKRRYVKSFKIAKNTIRYLISKDSSSYSSIPRLRIWNDALTKFKKNPVFGSGFGSSYKDKVHDKIFVHPHNIILQIFAETGLVGFGVFAILFGLIFKRAFLIYRQLAIDNRMTFLFYPLSLLFFFLFSSFHSDLSSEYFKWYFAGMIAGFDTGG